MSTASRFSKFHDNIVLTPNQYSDAKTKCDSVCKALHRFYYPNQEYTGATKYIIGSYGKETAIRPPSDVDVIFKIPWATYERFSKNKTGPRGLLNEVKTVLEKTFTTTEIIKPNGMVVNVSFVSFNVEVLPAYEWSSVDQGTFQVADTSIGSTSLPSLYDPSSSYNILTFPLLANNYGRWKKIDPKKEINELDSSNARSNGNTKALIQMMKKWVTYCSVPIKSVAIERLIYEFMLTYAYYNKGAAYYDYMVRDFLLLLKRKRYSTIFYAGNK
ncbi:MAG: nucleotidyltransferase [Tunicatimonas sp.]